MADEQIVGKILNGIDKREERRGKSRNVDKVWRVVVGGVMAVGLPLMAYGLSNTTANTKELGRVETIQRQVLQTLMKVDKALEKMTTQSTQTYELVKEIDTREQIAEQAIKHNESDIKKAMEDCDKEAESLRERVRKLERR